jgi:peptide deformylase
MGLNYKIVKTTDKNNHVLHEKREDISISEIPILDTFFKKMIAVSKMERAIGIAANQLGVKKRICAITIDHNNPKILINPHIKQKLSTQVYSYEGCLSVDKTHKVKRNLGLIITYYDTSGTFLTEEITDGQEAVVIQHEIDHLDGILITDIEEK